jgi:lysine 2-monooxygenase
MDSLDLAVIGAGAAGTWVAHAVQQARPDWSIALFERHERMGGRLRSVRVPGLDHPIELGGMRYLTSHRRVKAIVTDLGIVTRPFDLHGGTERSFLRGVFGDGPTDPRAGAGYDLPDDERGRSAFDLAREGFLRIVPDAETLDAEGWRRARAAGRYLDRRLIDWSFAEAMASVRSPEGHRFAVDAFGYDSGIRPHNIGTAIEYLLGGNDPNIEARVPVDGMDAIPKALAGRFQELGGAIHLGHDLVEVSVDEGLARLVFDGREAVTASRVVLALPVSALRALGGSASALGFAQRRIYDAIEGFPATKLYLWFDRPWWRHPTDGPKGIRTTTDLPLRKTFYFDTDPDAPAAILASYTDGLDSEPIVGLAGGASNGEPAPAPLLAAALRQLRTLHPYAEIPEPNGSAFMHWGSDPREIGWCYWLAGYNPDVVMPVAIQPEPSLPIFICGESFSRAQAWVEGALETAEAAVTRLLA